MENLGLIEMSAENISINSSVPVQVVLTTSMFLLIYFVFSCFEYTASPVLLWERVKSYYYA